MNEHDIQQEQDARIAHAIVELQSSLEVLDVIWQSYVPLLADDPELADHPDHRPALLTTVVTLAGAVRALAELHYFLLEPPEPE